MNTFCRMITFITYYWRYSTFLSACFKWKIYDPRKNEISQSWTIFFSLSFTTAVCFGANGYVSYLSPIRYFQFLPFHFAGPFHLFVSSFFRDSVLLVRKMPIRFRSNFKLVHKVALKHENKSQYFRIRSIHSKGWPTSSRYLRSQWKFVSFFNDNDYRESGYELA